MRELKGEKGDAHAGHARPLLQKDGVGRRVLVHVGADVGQVLPRLLERGSLEKTARASAGRIDGGVVVRGRQGSWYPTSLGWLTW